MELSASGVTRTPVKTMPPVWRLQMKTKNLTNVNVLSIFMGDNVKMVSKYVILNLRYLLSQRQILPKTLPRLVLILISLQRWQHRARNETKHFVSLHLVSKQRWLDYHNQHESAALIGLFHEASLVLSPVESYRDYQKPTQRGVQGYLSSLQRRVKGIQK